MYRFLIAAMVLGLFLTGCSFGAVDPPTPADAQISLKQLRQLRETLKWKSRPLINNNDGGEAPRGDVTPERFWARRSRRFEKTPLGAMFYCTGVYDLFTHATKSSTLFEYYREPVSRENLDPLWPHKLVLQGGDTLHWQTHWGHQNGWEVFFSLRMNDIHDGYTQSWDNPLMSDWKRMHPEFLMGKPGDVFELGESNAWSAVNYARPEVREKTLHMLQEVCASRDIDGIELDFLRSPPYFRESLSGEKVSREHLALMDDLMRKIRAMTEREGMRRGRPILVAVRVLDSPGASRAMGLDWEKWASEGLFDLLIGGGLVQFAPWEYLVEAGHAYNIPVYPDVFGHRGEAIWGQKDFQRLRGDVLSAWQGGADGVYLFNDIYRPNKEELTYAELADPDQLAARPFTQDFFPGYLFKQTFVPDARKYRIQPFIYPEKTGFFDQTEVSMRYYADPDWEIRYTRDGSPVSPSAPLYTGPFELTESTELRARAFGPEGKASAEIVHAYVKRDSIHFPPEPLPLNVFGQPLGMGKTALLKIESLPDSKRIGIEMTISDMDAQEEGAIYVNAQGPFAPPEDILDPGAARTAVLWLPRDALVPGENRITFLFEDNLDHSTAGFRVDAIRLVSP